MDKPDFYVEVKRIQGVLKAPKNQWNSFGKYNYRSCEDILEGFKKIGTLLVLNITDDVICVGDRIYVKSTAILTDGDNVLSSSSMARESLTKKGMDDSQITGTASSYARKYALNGLFCIDDTKDADSMNNNQNEQKSAPKNQGLTDLDKQWIEAAMADINALNQIQDANYRAFIQGNLK